MLTEMYDNWVDREESRTELISQSAAAAMAATLDLASAPTDGQALPPGWQWMFFNPVVRRSALGVDGHPQRGGFLPPIELPRRMWAGSRLRYLSDLPVGGVGTRHSRIQKVENKTGRRGSLWFVTVEHTTSADGRVCIVEEQDIVYREATAPGAAPVVPVRHEAQADWSREIVPDTPLLFRYSALTFNGHRIHYDHSYATQEEGYPGLVVHGPLTATLLQQSALEQGQGRPLSSFQFRGVSPLFVGQPFLIEGRANESGVELWARGPAGELAMSASATYR